MTTAGIIAVAILAVMIGLILWGIRGHRGYTVRDDPYGWGSGESD